VGFFFGVGKLTLNKTESVTIKGRTFMPEDGFIGLLTEIQDSFEDYLVTEGFWTRLGNLIRDKKPWLGD
jgi:hypothetical protein